MGTMRQKTAVEGAGGYMRCSMAGNAWFACYTHVRAELAAVTALEDRGFHGFCPTFRKQTRINGYKTEVTRPLFDRYMFVLFDPTITGKSEIKKVPGIMDILGHDGVPQRVSEDAIETLIGCQMMGAFDQTIAAAEPGDWLELVSGPLKGHMARLVKADTAAKRVRVLFELLGSEREMTLRFNQVRVLS